MCKVTEKNQEFILKSLCVLDIFTFQFFVFHFKPPCSAEELSALDVKTNSFIFENLTESLGKAVNIPIMNAVKLFHQYYESTIAFI